MATAEVQHPTAAVHDGSCFKEEEKNHNVPVEDNVRAAEAKDVQQLGANGVVEEEIKKGEHEEDPDKENNPKDHHEGESAAAVGADAGDAHDGLAQAVAQEVEAKLGIVQDGDVDVVVDSAPAPAADDEPKPPPMEEDEPRCEVPRKAAGATKAVVVPVNDDNDVMVDGEKAAALAETTSEAPDNEDVGADHDEEPIKEEKAQEE